MEKSRPNVDAVLLDSIDTALGVLGNAVKESLLLYLEKEHQISRQEFPKEVEQFTIALRHLLGYGSKVVEKIVIRNLVEKCEIPKESVTGKSLAEIIRLAKKDAGSKHAYHQSNAALDELEQGSSGSKRSTHH